MVALDGALVGAVAREISSEGGRWEKLLTP